MLTYLLSLPLYRGSLDLRSFEDYFVYLTNEGAKDFGKPSSAYKGEKSGTADQGIAEGTKTVPEKDQAGTIEKTRLAEEGKSVIPKGETGREIEKAEERPAKEETEKSAISKKTFPKVEEAPEEKAADLKEKGAKFRVSEDTGLEAKATPPEVDSGLFLKTMSGNVVIPFDAGFKKETVRVEKEKDLEQKRNQHPQRRKQHRRKRKYHPQR